MSLREKVYNSPTFLSVKQQPRLQILILIVLIILAASVGRNIYDGLIEKADELSTAQALNQRLLNVSNTTFSEETVSVLASQAESALAQIPIASSASAAEASALSELEQVIDSKVTRTRLNLLGSEEIRVGDLLFWSVRVEVVGQLPVENALAVFDAFSPQFAHRRIPSILYAPKVANTVNIVADVLYRQSIDDEGIDKNSEGSN